MQIRKRLLIKSLIGAVGGIIIGLLMMGEDRSDIWLILHLVASALYGAVANGGTIVYEIEKLGVLRATLIHYFITMSLFVIISLALGWFAGGLIWLGIVVLIMTVIYVMIWLFNYLYWKKTVREVNEELKNLKDE